jgi:murein DD-endopeptidase MepM/ murein hydrolase activator NlpD
MKSCFYSGMVITQSFGNDFKVNGKLYYKSMGINGHDGIDVVPKNKSDIRIFNIHSGIIMMLTLHPIYGNRISIWNKEKGILEFHNHMANFNKELKVGDTITEETYLGEMGATGKVFGAHNHFAISKADENGIRINRDNGYFGFIDPIPFL